MWWCSKVVDELTRRDMTLLAQILHTGPSDQGRISEARYLIKNLPEHLRQKPLFCLDLLRSSTICSMHKGLNRRVIKHVFALLKREVSSHLKVIYKFSNAVEWSEYSILESLRAINGMWTTPSKTSTLGTWAFQTNKCKACILSRVALNTIALQDLRTALLSRNQTKKPNPPPRLLSLVEELINVFDAEIRLRIYYNSGEAGLSLKGTRKTALKMKSRSKRVPKKLPAIPSVPVPIDQYSPSVYSQPSQSVCKRMYGCLSNSNKSCDLLEIIDGYTSTHAAAEQKAASSWPEMEGPYFAESTWCRAYSNNQTDVINNAKVYEQPLIMRMEISEESCWDDAEVGEEVPVMFLEQRETRWDLLYTSFHSSQESSPDQ
jgi:hypothetical protein